MGSPGAQPLTALEYADYLHAQGALGWFPIYQDRKHAEESVRAVLKGKLGVDPGWTDEGVAQLSDYLYRQGLPPSKRGPAHHVVDRVLRRLRESFPSITGAKIDHIPVVDVLQPSLNASALRAPAGDSLIIVNVGAVMALIGLNLALRGIFDARENADVQENEKRYIFARFLSLVSGDERFLDRVSSRAAKLDAAGTRNEKRILDLQIQFILAHEFQHHIRGHLDNASISSIRLTLGSEHTVDYYTPDQLCEFEADREAFVYMQDFCSSLPQAELFLYLIEGVVDQLLSFMALMEDLQDKLHGHLQPAGVQPDHPPARTRRERIRTLSVARGFEIQKASFMIEKLVDELSDRSNELLGEITDHAQD